MVNMKATVERANAWVDAAYECIENATPTVAADYLSRATRMRECLVSGGHYSIDDITGLRCRIDMCWTDLPAELRPNQLGYNTEIAISMWNAPHQDEAYNGDVGAAIEAERR